MHLPANRSLPLAGAALAAVLALASSASAQVHPSVVRCTPMSGPPGTHVVIVGGGFGAGTAVYLGGEAPLRVLRRTSRRLVVVIPPDARSAMLLVTNGDEEESCGDFTVTPAR